MAFLFGGPAEACLLIISCSFFCVLTYPSAACTFSSLSSQTEDLGIGLHWYNLELLWTWLLNGILRKKSVVIDKKKK